MDKTCNEVDEDGNEEVEKANEESDDEDEMPLKSPQACQTTNIYLIIHYVCFLRR